MGKFEITFAESIQSEKDYLNRSIQKYKEKEIEKRHKEKKSAMSFLIPFSITLIVVTYTLGYITPRKLIKE